MDDQVNPNPDQVEAESGRIIGEPGDSVFDDIWDWIQNAIASITRVVTDWINWAVNQVTRFITTWVTWLWDNVYAFFKSTWDTLKGWFNWLWDTISPWFTWLWDKISPWFTWLWDNVYAFFKSTWTYVQSLFTWLWDVIQPWFNTIITAITGIPGLVINSVVPWFTWLANEIQARVLAPMAAWWDQFLGRLFTPSEWIEPLLDAVTGWFTEDIPGSSPRWTGIFSSIGQWFVDWFVEFPRYMADNFPEKVAYGLSESFRWIGDTFNEVFESFNDAVLGLVRQIGPISPGTAMTSYGNLAKLGLVALGGLAGMTVAGEFLNPLSHLGLGHISAMIYDMTNYKLITGVMIGALTGAVLRTPLTYYFNDIFRPWLIRPGDFMELLSRGAFTAPEKLRTPELVQTVGELAPGGGGGFVNSMIGYYGYPASYVGFFRELSFAPMRYFALAGVARSGFWDEAWFIEANARSGYSPMAQAALMRMYYELVVQTRQSPPMAQVRRLSREGYTDMDQVREILGKAVAMETLAESRMYALELEQEFVSKEATLDISLRAFSRGILTESETSQMLARLGIPGNLIDVHLTREKLGLIRRISLPQEAVVPALQYVEE